MWRREKRNGKQFAGFRGEADGKRGGHFVRRGGRNEDFKRRLPHPFSKYRRRYRFLHLSAGLSLLRNCRGHGKRRLPRHRFEIICRAAVGKRAVPCLSGPFPPLFFPVSFPFFRRGLDRKKNGRREFGPVDRRRRLSLFVRALHLPFPRLFSGHGEYGPDGGFPSGGTNGARRGDLGRRGAFRKREKFVRRRRRGGRCLGGGKPCLFPIFAFLFFPEKKGTEKPA